MLNNLLFLDVEWANGLNRSLCQIALIKYDLSQDKIIKQYSSLINPLDTFDYHCIEIHHITSEEVLTEPTFVDVWPHIKDLFNDVVVVGHNVANADLYALSQNLKRFHLAIPSFKYIDTMALAMTYLKDVTNYKQSTLLAHYGYLNPKEHDALSDVRCNLSLFKELRHEFDINLDKWVKDYNISAKKFNFRLDKRISCRNLSELYGILNGLNADNFLNEAELKFLKTWYQENAINDPNNVVAVLIKHILKLGMIENYVYEELINVLVKESTYLNTRMDTLSLRILQGFIKGIMADTKLSDKEIYNLKAWLDDNQDLKGNYPYDLIYQELALILNDHKISECERLRLYQVLDHYLNPRRQIKALVEFKNKVFVLTGDFNYGLKEDVIKYLNDRGAIVKNSVSKKVDYVVCGKGGSAFYANGNYGTKIKRAKELGINIICEDDIIKGNK